MSKSTFPAVRNLLPFIGPRRLTLSKSMCGFTAHGRIQRAMRIVKRRELDRLALALLRKEDTDD